MALIRQRPKEPSYAKQYGRQWLGLLPQLAGQAGQMALRGAIGGYFQDQAAKAEYARRQELQSERLKAYGEAEQKKLEARRAEEERGAQRRREKQLYGGMARMAGEVGRPGMGAEILAKREAWRPPPTLGIPTEAAPAEPAIPGLPAKPGSLGARLPAVRGRPAQPALPGRKVWAPGVPGMGLREEEKTPEATAARFRQEMEGLGPAEKKKAQSAFNESYVPRLKLLQQGHYNRLREKGWSHDAARSRAVGNIMSDPYVQAMDTPREEVESWFPTSEQLGFPEVPGAPFPGPGGARPGKPRKKPWKPPQKQQPKVITKAKQAQMIQATSPMQAAQDLVKFKRAGYTIEGQE